MSGWWLIAGRLLLLDDRTTAAASSLLLVRGRVEVGISIFTPRLPYASFPLLRILWVAHLKPRKGSSKITIAIMFAAAVPRHTATYHEGTHAPFEQQDQAQGAVKNGCTSGSGGAAALPGTAGAAFFDPRNSPQLLPASVKVALARPV